MPRHRVFPLARFILHESGSEFDSRQRVLCSLGVEAGEAETTRRFRFLNWNFHRFYIPFGPLQRGLNLRYHTPIG